jgi:hypothetical protein
MLNWSTHYWWILFVQVYDLVELSSIWICTSSGNEMKKRGEGSFISRKTFCFVFFLINMHYIIKTIFYVKGINLGLPMVSNCSQLYYEYINIYVPLNTISIKQLSNIFCHKQTWIIKSILIHMHRFTKGKLHSA